MKNSYMIVIGVVFMILVALAVMIGSGALKKSSPLDTPDLNKYRSKEIPEECRLPEYESDINVWKEHLGHHRETLYCLDYFK